MAVNAMDQVAALIRDVPDFPKEGIIFKDITLILKDADAFGFVTDYFASRYRNQPIDTVVGIESRGFIFGAALAYKLGVGIVPVRKIGKLPRATVSESYSLEYGTATIEIHEDALNPGDRVVLIDDLLATGGTARAAQSLVERLGATIVETTFLIELAFLSGRSRLNSCPVHSAITL